MQSCWQNNSSASCFSLGKSSFGTQLVLLKKILLYTAVKYKDISTTVCVYREIPYMHSQAYSGHVGGYFKQLLIHHESK